MAPNTKIEWTHHTANLWHGCTKVHEGCDHCYAETLSKRWKRDIWGNDKPRMEIKSVWNDLKKFQKVAAGAGETQRVFVGSMMDVFEKPMHLIDSKGNPAIDANDGSPVSNEHLRERLFGEISAGNYPNLLFLFLTKRPSNINKYTPESWKENPPENVMFGTSPVNQATADKLIPQLLQVNGKKFLSMEPLLGPVNIEKYLRHIESGRYSGFVQDIDWVIVGGESGHGARPMYPGWARSIRDQCKESGVPFFFKQWGEWVDFDNISSEFQGKLKRGEANHRIVNIELNPPFTYTAHLLGKKDAGRMLDGDLYNGLPM